MKSYVLHGIGDLRYEEVEMPNCPKGWALVKVKAAGICSSDIPRIFKKGTYHFPTIPGHEFAGEIYSVGDERDNAWIGKHVGVFPLIPCRDCPQCAEKHYEMCSHYDYLGSRRDGGFAEYVVVPIWNIVPLPDEMSYVSAAMLEPLSVALHAVKLGGVKTGDEVAVVGTGMIGISAAKWAYKAGARRVTVIGRSELKRELVEKCGIEYKVCTDSTKTGQYDFVIEAVGSLDAVEMAIMSVKPAGTLLLMGNPSGDILLKQDIYWRILRKQLTVKGTWNSSYDGDNQSDWMEVVNAVSKNEIDTKPFVTHFFSQEHLKDGLLLMLEHKEPFCKIMTLWNN